MKKKKNPLLFFERQNQALAPVEVYHSRIRTNIFTGILILSFFLGIGIVGYKVTCNISWLDSLLNASMILSGMGPILTNDIPPAGKWFASIYALVSGVVFITTIGLVLSPIVHRIFHRFHLEEEGDK